MFLKRVAATGALFAILAAPVFAQSIQEHGSAGMHKMPPMADAMSTAHTAYHARTVRSAQRKLNRLGYKAGKADGKWGPRTAAAVKEFQGTTGLRATGRLDSQTLAALGVKSSDQASGAGTEGHPGQSMGGHMYSGGSMGSLSKGGTSSYGKPLGGGSKTNQY